MAAVCQFCRREFSNAQAVRAHLKSCDRYQSQRAAPLTSAAPSPVPPRQPALGSGSRGSLGSGNRAAASLDISDRIAIAPSSPPRAPVVAPPPPPTTNGSAATSKRREIIQRVKREALRKAYLFGPESQSIEAKIIIAIEQEFASLPVEDLPENELLVIASNICEGFVRENREAEQDKAQRAASRRELIRKGRNSLSRQLRSVEGLEFFERLRIEERVHAQLERLSGDESLEDAEELIDDVLAAEGIEWDDDDG